MRASIPANEEVPLREFGDTPGDRPGGRVVGVGAVVVLVTRQLQRRLGVVDEVVEREVDGVVEVDQVERRTERLDQ